MWADIRFVCSRGILNSCTVHSSRPVSSCGTDKAYLDSMVLAEGGSIYVCSELLSYFVDSILPKISVEFYLITGDSDLTMPKDGLQPTQFTRLIDNRHLRKWFCQNTPVQDHSKIVQLPIGLDYHTVATNPQHKWIMNGEGSTPAEQEKVLESIRSAAAPFHERLPKVFVNFGAFDKFGDRRSAIMTIPTDLMTLRNQAPRTLVWKFIAKHAFVLSPFGNGMDCHRTWEALILGAIPIVRGRQFDAMFADLPVLIVDSWEDVTELKLATTIEEFKKRKFNYRKLELSYWTEQFCSK